MIKTGMLKGILSLFGVLMFIVSLALIAVRWEFTTYEMLATIYIWITAVVGLAELPDL